MKKLPDVGLFDENPHDDFGAYYKLKEQAMASSE
jgi:hypothetical protein